MFVLQIASTKGRGGIVTAIRHYARMFSASEVASLTLYRGPALGALIDDGVSAMEAPRALTSSFGFLKPLCELRRAVAARSPRDPDLIIVHSDKALDRVRALWPRSVIVAPCHSDKVRRKRRAGIVVTLNPSQHDAVQAALRGAPAKVVLLGNPFVADANLPAAQPSTPRVVFCGRFIDTKDPGLLIRAAQHMSPAPQLCFIGAGPLELELKTQAAACGIQASFTGWLARPWEYMTQSDILVLPSSWEGLPYMVQEALAHGVSVVAADNPGNRFALKDGAFGELFAPGDAAALAPILARASAAPNALRQKATLGRASLEARFGPQAFFQALMNVALPLGEQKCSAGERQRRTPPTEAPNASSMHS